MAPYCARIRGPFTGLALLACAMAMAIGGTTPGDGMRPRYRGDRKLELPANGWTRRYRARVHGTVDEAKLAALANGITLEGVRYGAIEAKLDRQQRTNAWLDIALGEGKNREVRKVLAHLDLPVVRLIRVAFGPISTKSRRPSFTRHLNAASNCTGSRTFSHQ